MGRIEKLVEHYSRYIALPWQKDLAGPQRAIFIVYNKTDERKLRCRLELFEMATREAGHPWRICDLTQAFARWMAAIDYRDSYFESPEDLGLKLDDDFLDYVAGGLRDVLTTPDVDDQSVVGIFGIASLFGFARVSDLMARVERDIRGRLVVFFPGEHENGQYRLLDGRAGWNYLAVPITTHEAI
jgi:hypothetical protein